MFYYKASLSTVKLTMQWRVWSYCAVQSAELHHWKIAKHICDQIHITSLYLCFSNMCHKIMGHKLNFVYNVMQCFFQWGQNINYWNSDTFWNTKYSRLYTHNIADQREKIMTKNHTSHIAQSAVWMARTWA
jgi:hypothetical protein